MSSYQFLIENAGTPIDPANPPLVSPPRLSVTGLANGGFMASFDSGDQNNPKIEGAIGQDNGLLAPSPFAIATDHFDVDVAGLVNGGAVAMYSGPVSGTVGIFARLLDANGNPLGNEFTVSSPQGQMNPSVAGLKDGGGVGAWERGQDIYGKVFNADGSEKDLAIATHAAIIEEDPSVAALADGGFAVTWTEHPFAAVVVAVARYSADGSQQGSKQIIVPQGDHPQIVGLQNGGFAIAQHRASLDGGEIGLTIYGADGIEQRDVLANAMFTSGAQDQPTITTLSNGYIAVGWTSHSGLGDVAEVAIFDQDGNLILSDADSFADSATDLSLAGIGHGSLVGIFVDHAGGMTADYKVVDVIRTTTGGGNDDSLPGDDLQDQMYGGAGNDELKGGGGADFLVGDEGDDVLVGGAEDDFLSGGEGGDKLVGGAGADDADYTLSPAGVSIDLHSGTASGGDAGGDTLTEIENLRGSNFADVLTGDDGANRLIGLSGNDRLAGLGGNDSLFGADGDDVLDGGDGADRMSGLTGDDRYFVDNAGDLVVEGTSRGVDTVETSISYTLTANVENLVLLPGGTNGTGNALDNRITGNDADNLLTGGLGDDRLDGAAGDDTAAFSHDFNDYTVEDFGAKIMVIGPDGSDTLTAIEHLKFADTTITPVDDGDPLFDTLYYLSRNADVFHAGVNARDHFDNFGRHEGRDPNPLFSVDQYLGANPDVRASGINPLEHYHQIGWQQGRDPGANFDTTLYLVHNPDVAAAGVDPLAHYLQFGMSEGRQAYPSIVGGFDAQYYLLHNPDVAAAGVDPLAHFNMFGWHEGRNPNAWFDTAGYLAHYADVAAAGVNPLQHYEQFGWQEGRDPSAGFDALGYLAANPDVAAAHVNPLDHFLQFGIYEGRAPVNDGVWH